MRKPVLLLALLIFPLFSTSAVEKAVWDDETLLSKLEEYVLNAYVVDEANRKFAKEIGADPDLKNIQETYLKAKALMGIIVASSDLDETLLKQIDRMDPSKDMRGLEKDLKDAIGFGQLFQPETFENLKSFKARVKVLLGRNQTNIKNLNNYLEGVEAVAKDRGERLDKSNAALIAKVRSDLRKMQQDPEPQVLPRQSKIYDGRGYTELWMNSYGWNTPNGFWAPGAARTRD